MASRGRGRRGRPRGAGQAPLTFDQPPVFTQQAFAEAVGIAAAAVAQASSEGSQGGPSNLQRFRSHHPPTFRGGGDPMVADHWFMQIENILEAMEITSDTARIRLDAFQLDGEAQVWWRWARASRDIKAMTWPAFQELFMSKYFPETARHAKAQDFLELKQGAMTVMDYVARFTELARFADDYVATDMVKVRRFENGLKLSIRGKIVSLRLQDMDSMVGTALTIEREIEDARCIRDMSTSGKRKGDQSSSSIGKRQRASSSREPQMQGQPGPMTCFYCHQPGHMKRDCPRRQGSQGFELVQVQSSVGQAQTQVVPSHSSMGQRNQFPLRGATQAPSAVQTGQRSQGMGRGQVQGSQARTSGTQGRVYAMVPEAERADQPDVQGMFLIMHVLIGA